MVDLLISIMYIGSSFNGLSEAGPREVDNAVTRIAENYACIRHNE